MHARELLLHEMQAVGERLRWRLDGLTDDEYLWEPVPGCWTLRRTESGWAPDYEVPDPDPPPFTTIAWRLSHVTMINVVWRDWLFGDRRLMFWDVELPGEAEAAVALWDRSFRTFRDAFDASDPAGDPEAVPRYEDADLRPRILTVWSTVSENEHHGAEIGCLRDLWRERRRP